jgi:hypothetical protein
MFIVPMYITGVTISVTRFSVLAGSAHPISFETFPAQMVNLVTIMFCPRYASLHREKAHMLPFPTCPRLGCGAAQEKMLEYQGNRYQPKTGTCADQPGPALLALKRNQVFGAYIFPHVFFIFIVHSWWNKPST